VLIELFSLGFTARGVTSEYRLKIGVFAPTGSFWP